MEVIFQIRKGPFAQGKDLFTIIVLRDLRNTVASIIRSTSKHVLDHRLLHVTGAWRGYAHRYLKQCRFCVGDKDIYFILFDKWFSDSKYRQQICADLGIPFTDAGINRMSGYAGGSSFDGKRFDGRAQEMDVLNRWQNFQSHELYQSRCTNELLKMNTLIFGAEDEAV
jgi:hypothetical protein